MQAPLDEDGYALVSSWGNSSLMATFLARAAEDRELCIDVQGLSKFAESQWGSSPRKGATLKKIVAMMVELGVAVEKTSTSSGTLTTSSEMGPDVVPLAEDDSRGSSPLPVLIALVVGVSLCMTVVVLSLRHLGCWPSDLLARIGGSKLVQAKVGSRHAAAQPDLEAASLPTVPSLPVAEVAAESLPRLGLAGRSVARYVPSEGFKGHVTADCLTNASSRAQVPQVQASEAALAMPPLAKVQDTESVLGSIKVSCGWPSSKDMVVDEDGYPEQVNKADEEGLHIEDIVCQQTPPNELPQSMIAASLDGLPPAVEEQDGDSIGCSSNRSFRWLDAPGGELAVRDAASSGSNVNSHVDSVASSSTRTITQVHSNDINDRYTTEDDLVFVASF